MGGGSSSPSPTTILKSSELTEFHNMTLFSNNTLIRLHEFYKRFSAIQIDDGIIDFDEFCIIMNKKDKNLTKRIFNAIDINLDGNLNYREFIKFISVFINGSKEEQISISYKIFMNPETKLIEYQNMKLLLSDIIKEEESLKSLFTEREIDDIVQETFKEINGNIITPINLEGYQKIIQKYPHILQWFKLDLNVLFKNKSYKQKEKVGCFS